MLAALPLTAQQIMVELKNGNQDYCVASLDELQSITFNGSTVNIAHSGGETYSETMGNIARIYFGDDATATTPGDVTNDGSVNVADVTFVVSEILNSSSNSIADINNDGSVNVADVTKVVSIILNAGAAKAPNKASSTASRVLYVNNSNATNLAINTDDVEQITFDETQQLVTIELTDGAASTFATGQVNNISYSSNNGTTLVYNNSKAVSFDTADGTSYNEVTETIITDELNDESGDFVENFTTSKIITIVFSNGKVTCNSNVSDVTYTITNNSHIVINSTRSKVGYVVTGSCTNGSLKIYSEKKFQIQLANLTLTNPAGPAINIQSSKTAYIKNSGNNTLCDGATYSAAANNESQKGTFFSEGQLIFDGTGTLNVTSKGGHAICSDDYIRIRSGNINIVSSVKDGFHTNDIFRVGRMAASAPTISINAQGDGIDCEKGEVIIEAGKITMNTGGEAINVSYSDFATNPTITPNATIKGGFIKATTTGEKAAIIKTSGNFTQTGGIIQGEVKGDGSKIVNCDGNITITAGKITGFSYGSLSSDTTTAGGFKCDGDILINGGTIAIDSRGQGSKGINCNGNIVINGGKTTLLANAGNFIGNGYDRKTRAITTYNITVGGGEVYTNAYDHAINADNLNFTAGTIQAYSSTTQAISGSTQQSGGWLLTQDAE